MPIDDLSGLSDLDGKQRGVLTEKLGITTCYELIMADRQRVVDAFSRRANRPTLEEVAIWQDEARRTYASTITTSSSTTAGTGWEQVATFVVAFEQRRKADATERRISAEQTEVEPEAAPQQRSQWSEWACDDVCRWMVECIGEPATTRPAPAQIADATEPTATETGATGSHSRIDIERATLADAHGDAELVAGSRPVPEVIPFWVQPTQLVVTLGGAPTGPGTSVVLQLVQAGAPKRSIAGQLDAVGRVAKIKLSGLASGEYEPTIAAWAADGSALPRVVKLPTIAVVGAATGPSGPP